jgi:uncharacterized protein involved in exopolysaccharide biosynthesis
MSIAESQGPRPSPSFLSEPLDLAGVVGAFRRRLPLLLTVALTVTFAAILASLILTPIYAASAAIKVDPTQRPLLDVNSVVNGAPPDQAIIDTEVSVISSRAVAENVVRQLDLVKDLEFGEQPGPLDWLIGHHDRVDTPNNDAFSRTVTRVQKALHVERDGTTFLIDVTFRSKDPGKAATIANAFADEYIGFSLKTKVDAAAQRAAWLNQRLASLGDEAQHGGRPTAQRHHHGLDHGRG